MMDFAARYPMTENPWGWYALALSHELAPGELRSVEALGRGWVVFRTKSGQVTVIDPWCPHLGAHLGDGKVTGERITCPFHHWTFAADGRCVGVPRATAVPEGANLKVFPSLERNGAILVWHGPPGREPWFEPPALSDEGWSSVRWESLALEMHIVEIAENGVDIAHFPTTHGSERSGATLFEHRSIPFRFDLNTVYDGDGIGVPDQRVAVTTSWSYYGPGVFLGESIADDLGTRVRQLYHFTPIPEHRVLFRIAIQSLVSTVPADILAFVQEKNAEISIKNLMQDAPIWRTKRHHVRPTPSDADGPIFPLRSWERQFYDGSEAFWEDAADPPARYGSARRMSRANENETAPSSPAFALASPMVSPPPSDESFAVRDSLLVKMPAAFNRKAAGNRSFIVEYDIQGRHGGTWHIQVANGTCQAAEGRSPQEPAVRVAIADVDWLAMQSGKLDRAKAYLSGRLKISGDLKLAMRLGDIFP